MEETNKHLKDFLNALNSKYNIWVLPMNDEAAAELMNELKEIVGEDNWEEYLKKQMELEQQMMRTKKGSSEEEPLP